MDISLITKIFESKIYKDYFGILLSLFFYSGSYASYRFGLTEGKWFFYFAFSIGSINLIYTLYIIFKNIKNDRLDDFYLKKNFKKYQKKHASIFVFQMVSLILILLIPLFYVGGNYILGDTESELEIIVEELIDDSMNDTQKVDALLSWFDRGGNSLNFSNLYYRTDSEDPLLRFYTFYIYEEDPHFCVRFRFIDDPKWIISSKCGKCGETSSLFRRMGEIAGLNVSEVHCNAEDHAWNEVYIKDQEEPLIIDATVVDSSKNNSTGYKLSNFMEEKVAGDQRKNGENPEQGNVSIVYATFHDESKKYDVSERYTKVINLTVNVTNTEGEPLSDCSVKILSYNRPKKYGSSSWGLNNKTNESGQCTFTLGGGRYKFEIKHEDDWFPNITEKEIFWENDSEQFYKATYKPKTLIQGLSENPHYIYLLFLVLLNLPLLWNCRGIFILNFKRLFIKILNEKYFKLYRFLFLVTFTLLILRMMINSLFFNIKPDNFTLQITLAIFSVGIACHGVIIAFDSDKKMKSIATKDFLELTDRFWDKDRAQKLYDEKNIKERDTLSWQLVNIFRQAEKLHEWADMDTQERLIKEFKTFLQRLRKKNVKKYWIEVKNYRSTAEIAMKFKTGDNNKIKNELIEEITNWLGKKQKRESNERYLERKNNEIKDKKKYDFFEKTNPKIPTNNRNYDDLIS